MSIRDRFEARYPCPEGVHRTESGYEPIKNYSNCAPEDIKSALFQKEHAEIHTARWEAYQAAMEDAVPEPVEPICAPHDDLNDAFPGAESWARGWNDCRRAMLSSTPAPKDDQ